VYSNKVHFFYAHCCKVECWKVMLKGQLFYFCTDVNNRFARTRQPAIFDSGKLEAACGIHWRHSGQ